MQELGDATKARLDKLVLDKSEEKAQFDLVQEKNAAEATQLKATVDKALVDFGEVQVRGWLQLD